MRRGRGFFFKVAQYKVRLSELKRVVIKRGRGTSSRGKRALVKSKWAPLRFE